MAIFDATVAFAFFFAGVLSSILLFFRFITMGSVLSRSRTIDPPVADETWEELVALNEHSQEGIPFGMGMDDDRANNNKEATNNDATTSFLSRHIPRLKIFIKNIPSVLTLSYHAPADNDFASNLNEEILVLTNEILLPLDIYTHIWEFLVDFQNDTALHDTDTVAAFRVVNRSSKTAFNLLRGWTRIGLIYKRQAEMALNKIRVLNTRWQQGWLPPDTDPLLAQSNPARVAVSLTVTGELQDEVVAACFKLSDMNHLIMLYKEGDPLLVDPNVKINLELTFVENGGDWRIEFRLANPLDSGELLYFHLTPSRPRRRFWFWW